METITSADELKDKINELERRQQRIGREIKEDFHDTYESMNPANVLKRTVQHLSSDPDLKKDIVKAAVILVVGYLAKRVVVAASRNPFRIILGNIVEVAVAGFIARNPEKIRALANRALKLVLKLRGQRRQNLLNAAPAV